MKYDIGKFDLNLKKKKDDIFYNTGNCERIRISLKLSLDDIEMVIRKEAFTDEDGKSFQYSTALNRYYIYYIDHHIAEIDDTELFIKKCKKIRDGIGYE